MNGLAQRMGQQQPQMPTVDQVVVLLKQGMAPEELVQQGIPVELVQAAMEMVSAETTQVDPQEAGLAGMMLKGI